MISSSSSHLTGLSLPQVAESRLRFGENRLTPASRESLWVQFLHKFNDPIIRILLLALFLSLLLAVIGLLFEGRGVGILLEPLGILLAVVLATGIGFLLEVKANKAFDLLVQANDDALVKVIRGGNVCTVARWEIVVGDAVWLDTGDEVPADGLLLQAVNLQVDESSLTGEPLSNKFTQEREEGTHTYPTNRLYRGTVLLNGHGVLQVTQVGDATEQGKVFTSVQIDDGVRTPLNEQLDRLGSWILRASYLIGVLILLGRMLMYLKSIDFDYSLLLSFDSLTYFSTSLMLAITFIVVAAPEGLPMSVTLSLALSMRKMLLSHNLVRKLHACETMGATSVICTDKTGTLTRNQMRLHTLHTFSPRNEQIMQENIALNSTAHLDQSVEGSISYIGNPTEGALLLHLHEMGISYLSLRENQPPLHQIPFSTERKYMATWAHSPSQGETLLFVKGASEILLSLSDSVATADGLQPVSMVQKSILDRLQAFQQMGMRTLGFAYRPLSASQPEDDMEKEIVDHLVFLGIAAIADPVREDVPQAVETCMKAGIRVIIVTGDTPGTAREIGRQIGIWHKEDEQNPHALLTGEDFASLDEGQLTALLPQLKIISRARPLDKERLVRLLQQNGEVVAVTGDGTNDAPALKRAQVGLSMGDGTAVAKEASDITILDNSFSSIGHAVLWGRSLYRNIQRFIMFQLTVNVAAGLIVLLGSFLGTESIITIPQMLWVNLIMDTFAAMALASLPPNESLMREKPRKRTDFILSAKMGRQILLTGLLFFFPCYLLFLYFHHTDIHSLNEFSFSSLVAYITQSGQLPDYSVNDYERTIFFTLFVLLQFWNLFNVKVSFTGHSSFYGMFNSPVFLFIAATILVGQFFIVYFGGELFSVVPIPASDWWWLLLATSSVIWVHELLHFAAKGFQLFSSRR